MEDKKNKPVPEKNMKKPTGKSMTGKPLDGIEINPQLDDKRRTNEDFAVLTASLQERKALTIAQRQQRSRQFKRIQPKLKRAKEISQGRLAGPQKLQARAEAKARAFLKSRISSRKDIPYAELTTSEKIQVDTAVAKKTKLIKRIAARLLPKLRKAEFERLKSFHTGAPMKSLHSVTATEEFSNLFANLNDRSTLELVDIIENSIVKFEKENNPLGLTLRRMLNSTIGTDSITETLMKKSEKTGIPFSTLKEVFERGASLYVEDSNQTQEQIAFNRVNSYIAKGRAWTLDADLREHKIVNDQLDESFSMFLEAIDKSHPIVKEYNALKKHDIKTLRSMISRQGGVVDTSGFKSKDHAVSHILRAKHGHKKVDRAFGFAEQAEIVDRPPPSQKVKKKHQEFQKKIIDEAQMKPYVKPHVEKGSTKQSGWVASDKYGKKKYFGMDFKASAHKHAGISEDTAAQREIGTKSLTKKYQKDTPGQEKADLNETFNMAWTAGIGVTLSAEECGIKMKPAFELHPDVIDAMEEVRSADIEGVVVRTASGKTVVRKQKRNRKIIGTGNLTDGKPDDTV